MVASLTNQGSSIPHSFYWTVSTKWLEAHEPCQGKAGANAQLYIDWRSKMLNQIAALFKSNKTKAPDVDAIRREGFGDGYTVGFVEGAKAGAENERERIRGVYQFLPNPKHETLLENYMFDGVTTATEAALRVIKVERQRASFKVAKR
jgi:hypothetical protein